MARFSFPLVGTLEDAGSKRKTIREMGRREAKIYIATTGAAIYSEQIRERKEASRLSSHKKEFFYSSSSFPVRKSQISSSSGVLRLVFGTSV